MNITTVFNTLQGECQRTLLDLIAARDDRTVSVGDLVIDYLEYVDDAGSPTNDEVVNNYYYMFVEDKLPPLEEIDVIELDGRTNGYLEKTEKFDQIYMALQVVRGDVESTTV